MTLAVLCVASLLWAAAAEARVKAPEPPAQRAGISERTFIDNTSLGDVPGQLVTPKALLTLGGVPLPDSDRLVAALRAKDGDSITLPAATIADLGHYAVGFYDRPGATADPISAFADFFRDKDAGSPAQNTAKDGDWIVTRYIKLPANVPIDVVGLRFNADLSTPPATLAIPGGDVPGAFLSSDPTLTQTWYSAASTTQLSMMATSGASYGFFDSPERDRQLWLWYDATANPTAYYAFGPLAKATAYASYAIGDAPSPCPFAVNGTQCRGLPDDLGWTEHDLASLYDFYGDPAIVSSHYPHNVLAHQDGVVQAHLDPRGLYRTGYLPVPPNPMNPAKLNDHSMTDEMWVYAGLLGSKHLADAAGDSASATVFQTRADLLKQAVNQYLWNDQKGAFVYYYGSDHVDQAGNAMAVIYGLATPEQSTRILTYLHEHNDRLYDWAGSRKWGVVNPAGSTDFDRPFLTGDADFDVSDWGAPYSPLWGAAWGLGTDPDDFSRDYNYNYALSGWAQSFEVQADFARGDDAAALSLIRRAWGTMLRWGPGTFYEQSRYDGTPAYRLGKQHNTVVHRWASGVGALLQQYVLGIRPATPGFKTWQIDPHGGDLDWCQGRVPTPAGELAAWWQWTRSGHQRRGYTMVVTAPDHTTGSVRLPVDAAHGVVTVDGTVVWREGTAIAPGQARVDVGRGGVWIENLGPGEHTIAWDREILSLQ